MVPSIFTADIFIDALMLLVHDQSTISKELVKQLCEVVRSELSTAVSNEDAQVKFYLELLQTMLKMDGTEICNPVERQALLLKFKTHTFLVKHKDARASLEAVLSSTSAMSEARICDLMRTVRNKIIWYHSIQNTKKIYGKLNDFSITTDSDKKDRTLAEVNELASSISDIYQKTSSTADKAKEKIDFSDKITLRESIANYRMMNEYNIYRTGLQGLNRMFGHRGGIALGESIVFNAMSHHYKSMMLLSVARWTIQYNIPKIEENTGIPTVLFVSLENEVSKNMMLLFREAYICATHTDPGDKSDDEIIDFVYDFFNQNNWKLIVERRLGDEFGYDELRNLHQSYTEAGHRIMVCVIDYMNMMKKPGNDTLGNHLKLRELYTKVVNFLKNQGCTLVTAHQLNRDAAKLAQTAINVVDKFGIGYLADGMDPQREVDVVIYLHIEKSKMGGVPYLTMRIDKHRYVHDTPEEWKRTAYRFTPMGIVDDVDSEDRSIRDIHSDKYVPPVSSSLAKVLDIDTVGSVAPLQPGEEVFMD